MAGFDPRMPSEDEDFDAVAAPVRRRKPRTPSQNLAPKSPVRVVPNARTEQIARTVAVSTGADYQLPEDVAPAQVMPAATAPQAPQQAAYAQEAYEPESEPITAAVDQPSAPEYVEPLHEAEPIKAAKPPKQPKAPKQPRPAGSRQSHSRTAFEVLLVAAVLGLGLWTWQLYTDRKALRSQVTSLQANPQAAIQKQTEDLIATVGGLITLPAGETPTIANVSDATQARQQSAFFNDAQNGDKVLMYVKAGEAILYRPSTSKIILVAPLTFNSDGSTVTPTPTPPATKKP